MYLLDSSVDGMPCIIVGDLESYEVSESEKRYSNIFLITSSAAEFKQKKSELCRVTIFNVMNESELPELMRELMEWIMKNSVSAPGIKVFENLTSNLRLYEKILQELVITLDSMQRIRNSRKSQGYWVQKRILKNLPWILSNSLIAPKNGVFEKKLAVVVGAGPSLDKSLPAVAKWSFRPVIIAADTALSAVQRCGLEADFVVCIDPQKNCDSCKIEKKSGIGIFASDIDESFLRLWSSDALCIGKGEATDYWLRNNGLGINIFKRCSNAGLTGIRLADALGFNNIMLIGMDLACEHSRYANIVKRQISFQNENLVKIPGNYDDFVSTPFPGDWKDTCDACTEIAMAKTIVNVNDRGAAIESAILIHSDKLDDLEQTYLGSLESVYDSASIRSVLKVSQQNCINHIVKKLKKICKNELEFFSKLKDLNSSVQIRLTRDWVLRNESSTDDALRLFGSHVYNILDLMVGKIHEDIDATKVAIWIKEMYELLLSLKELDF